MLFFIKKNDKCPCNPSALALDLANGICVGDFSIKTQNKPIIQTFNCKIFYNSAIVHFYI